MVLPFIFWCKCFTPSDDDLLVASNEWRCAIRQEELFYDNEDFDSNDGGDDGENSRSRGGQEYYFYDDDDDEKLLLTKVSRLILLLGFCIIILSKI